MKHHISLVGGQILPLYLGIVENDADYIHFVCSKDSAAGISVLKDVFREKKIKTYVCNAFNYVEIMSLYNSIVSSFPADNTFVFNITGGTKLMALAANKLLKNPSCKAFYFNQDLSYYELPSYKLRDITTKLKMEDYIRLSDNKISSYVDISAYKDSDFKASQMISNFSAFNSRAYSSILKFVKQEFENYNSMPIQGEREIDDNLFVNWDKNGLEISTASSTLLEIHSEKATNLLFNGGWWELLVAQAINKWSHSLEVYTNVLLPYKNENGQSKNEIDVLVNTGKKMIFIECKSGNIVASDINKIKAVREIYGGTNAKSLLVSKYLPKPNIIEKCQELNIDVFYCYENNRKVNDLNMIINALDKLVVKSSV